MSHTQHHRSGAPTDEVSVEDLMLFGTLSKQDPRAIAILNSYQEHKDKGRLNDEMKIVLQHYKMHGSMTAQQSNAAYAQEANNNSAPAEGNTGGGGGGINKPYSIQVEGKYISQADSPLFSPPLSLRLNNSSI